MLDIGRIARPHGVKGDVAVVLTTNRTERVDKGSVLHTDHGILTVRSSRPHKTGYIVDFVECNDRNRADELRGVVLRAEPIDDPDELWVHDLIGARVTDQDGVARGSVVQVLDNPASDILELDSGALVPLHFVTDIVASESITVDVPAGLFDLADDDDDDDTAEATE